MNKTLARLKVGAFTVLVAPLAISCTTHRVATTPRPPDTAVAQAMPTPEAVVKTPRPIGGRQVPGALARKLAENAKAAPNSPTDAIGDPESYAEQDWLEHSVDGAGNEPPPFEAFATARNDWFGLLGRPARGTGKWDPHGPTNGLNDLTNLFRDRTVYNAGTENFGGRTVHGVISPSCEPEPGECTLWIAASNGGVWRTDNALATDDPVTPENEGPAWEFVSGQFEQQNVSSLELDPNDPNHKTIWAGTGEPNACGSGCEVGVGVYLSKDGRKGWAGPLGAPEFFGRGVGSIQVKPGDSKTVFVATGRATRGISNSCCGGTDALIPRAQHFGVWRSQDEGKTWLLVNQGAEALCTASTPDAVSLNTTLCSPRGARRIQIDPVDPNTVYASFFARGIWRSRSNGDPGTWEQIFARVGPAANTNERPEFDVVKLPSGETRMYVGVGGGGVVAHFRRSDAVREAPAATVRTSFVLLTNTIPDTPGYSSYGYCDGQCSYDNYVYAPANPDNAPFSGANHDVVYLLGVNQYNENNTGTGRSNGRAVLVSTDGGAVFTDMTEDARGGTHPGALHPDHHALVVNPSNWKQFFDLGDGGVNRSNGVFVSDVASCIAPPHSFAIPSRVAFCNIVLSRVPERLTAINRGLRTLATYTLDYDRNNLERISAGTQDNGSWETLGDRNDWLNVNIADGGPNRYDASGADSEFALTAFQSGSLMVRYIPMKQEDANWISDTLSDPSNVPPYALELSAFIVPAETDAVMPGWMWTGREHVFRSKNYGRNPVFGPNTEAAKAAHRANCNIWTGVFSDDIDGIPGYSLPGDSCDDWQALGDPGPNGRLTSATYGTRAGLYVSVTQRAYSDSNTLWAATGTGRIFISKNANNPDAAAVTFVRLDSLDPKAPPRYPTDIFVDRTNPNHAWITYSGYSSKTPLTPGHIFEVFYNPPTSPNSPPQGIFTNRDGHKINGYGDIPANAIIQTNRGTIYVGTDYGVVVKEPNSTVWKMAPAGLPNIDVADLIYVPEKDALYAATHGQGVWELKVQ